MSESAQVTTKPRRVSSVTLENREHYAVDVTARRHHLVSDEPEAGGGQDRGPAPFDLVLAGLGSCTAITLRMYADRKGWPVQRIGVHLEYLVQGRESRQIERVITIEGGLDAEQRARLADIAERTPVTLALKGGTEIHTRLA